MPVVNKYDLKHKLHDLLHSARALITKSLNINGEITKPFYSPHTSFFVLKQVLPLRAEALSHARKTSQRSQAHIPLQSLELCSLRDFRPQRLCDLRDSGPKVCCSPLGV